MGKVWAKGRKNNTLIRVHEKAHAIAKKLAEDEKKSMTNWVSDLIYQVGKIMEDINSKR